MDDPVELNSAKRPPTGKENIQTLHNDTESAIETDRTGKMDSYKALLNDFKRVSQINEQLEKQVGNLQNEIAGLTISNEEKTKQLNKVSEKYRQLQQSSEVQSIGSSIAY